MYIRTSRERVEFNGKIYFYCYIRTSLHIQTESMGLHYSYDVNVNMVALVIVVNAFSLFFVRIAEDTFSIFVARIRHQTFEVVRFG